ncbi:MULTISPECIES: MHYT domain-containing protein [unclassified Nocardia]|uniref:MHYT domain-containing protein n=1 Tax=unclassified Nocardia TaxID=2637762 RepID=UPI00342A138F
MLELDHFSHGWLTPVMAYLVSFIGSALALRCVVHARSSDWPAGWLATAAVSLGGAGIWVMHFTAMLGFSIHGATIRYDVPMTLLSAVIAILVVWVGLSIVVHGRNELVALPIGGAVTGIGVAAMHYLGMYAMKTTAHVEYDRKTVAVSVVIAVVAATAALWFMLHVRGLFATIGAALIMGVAVCGMHYVGMTSMHASHSDHQVGGGIDPLQLVTPLIVTVTMVIMMLMVVVGLAEIDERSTREALSVRREPREPSATTTGAWPVITDVRHESPSWGLRNSSQTEYRNRHRLDSDR